MIEFDTFEVSTVSSHITRHVREETREKKTELDETRRYVENIRI